MKLCATHCCIPLLFLVCLANNKNSLLAEPQITIPVDVLTGSIPCTEWQLCLEGEHNTMLIQEAPQCDKTRFSTIQPSIDVTGIRNDIWQWRKNDAVILVALVACTNFGVNRSKQTKVIEQKLNFYF